MAYTPELNLEHSRTLRRIAWSMGMPMTKAMAEVFTWLPGKMDNSMVCESCRDRTYCEGCAFNH